MTKQWTRKKILDWISAQDWYQTIPVIEGIVTPGKTASAERLKHLDDSNLVGKSVLDVGSNSGMYCFECKRRNASRVLGIEKSERRLHQARTLAEIMGLDVEFRRMNLLEAGKLPKFDIVLCFAVVTELTDMVQALLILKELTRERLYLELDVFGLNPRDLRLPFRPFGSSALRLPTSRVTARLRKTKKGWSLAPSLQLIENLMGDEFTITDLGPSVRYRLLMLDRRSGNGKAPNAELGVCR